MGLIYLDTCLLIYLTEDHPRWGQAVVNAIASVRESRFAISPLTKCECLVGPLKEGDTAIQARFESLFEQFVILEITESTYLHAAQLRARYGLKTPDALHLACAQENGCNALWTNDDRLERAGHGLPRNILRVGEGV